MSPLFEALDLDARMHPDWTWGTSCPSCDATTLTITHATAGTTATETMDEIDREAVQTVACSACGLELYTDPAVGLTTVGADTRPAV